ncbi:glycosyltransferase family 2 protein [Govanella unica]|uniref:Glycosyltransferase n=1 Tax=Govanella unica TaxID=2975056 RepID=A0A9X3TY15_9PROT|nr:glycosyltransferase [Govania unica]MDA5193886.1 glycosyltransferase [Govania unica]
MSVQTGAALASAIIPTTARAGRAKLLWRAIESVRLQKGTRVHIIVVVNGPWADDKLLESLRAQPDIEVIRLAEGHVAQARLAGRRHVITPYFAFLDDDDELLPDMVGTGAGLLADNPALDVVVFNGRADGPNGTEQVYFEDFLRFPVDFERAQVEGNLIASCGAVYRTATVGVSFFEHLPRTMEMTVLGHRLAVECQVKRLDEMGFWVHTHEMDRLSATGLYKQGTVEVLNAMAMRTGRRDIIRLLARRKGAAYHDLSTLALQAGNWGEALKFHIRSLFCPSGWRYALFTRHFLRPRTKSGS